MQSVQQAGPRRAHERENLEEHPPCLPRTRHGSEQLTRGSGLKAQQTSSAICACVEQGRVLAGSLLKAEEAKPPPSLKARCPAVLWDVGNVRAGPEL